MKWLVDTMGIDELRERIVKERTLPHRVGHLPGRHPRARRRSAATRPAGIGTEVAADGGIPIEFNGPRAPYAKWELANVVRGRANGTVSAYAHCRLGDITTEQFRGLAQLQRDFDVEVRITNRQNFVLRGLTEDQLPTLYERLVELDMAARRAPSSPATS